MSVKQLVINDQRLLNDFKALTEIGETIDGGVNRLALSNEDLQARAWFADQVDAAGLMMRDDDVGNLSGVLFSDNPNAQTMMIGSHMDTVPNGGRYDGAIGVLGGLECLRTIKEQGIKLPFHLEVIDFTDEEGAWQSLFGSKGLVGKIHTHETDAETDYGPFRAALFRAGIRPVDIHKAKRDPKTVCGYLELHIEQGPRLDREKIDIGIVNGIVGRLNYEIVFRGEASHSGTTERDRRKDALLGAATFITQAHQLWHTHYPTGIFNCGNIQALPGAFNIIPSEAKLKVEIRHEDEATLDIWKDDLLNLIQSQADLHGLGVSSRLVQHTRAVRLSEKMESTIESVCQDFGVSYRYLTSFAGHDAQVMSSFTDTGMIFIPSVNGISHSPHEFTEWEDVVRGTNILLHCILKLGKIK